MKIVLPGGSGQVGTLLARHFHAVGHDVVVLSRMPKSTPWRTVVWDGRTFGDWVAELNQSDVLINLAGYTVNCRYNARNRQQILQSRVETTILLGDVLRTLDYPPQVWLQASTATIYAHRYDAPNDEYTGIIGGNEPHAPDTWRFSIDVAQAWERALHAVAMPHIRTVLMRSAMVMSPDKGGVFDVLTNLARFGLGGKVGDGKQFVSWVHEFDFIRALEWLIQHPMEDIVNIASPNPLPNAQFMQILRQHMHMPFGLPARAWMAEIGAVFLRTETELILKSRRVIPTRLLNAGFEFAYPTWQKASAELYQRWSEPSKQ